MTIDLSISTLGLLAGTLLMGYGAVREALALFAKRADYGEGRYGERPYGGDPSETESRLISLGVQLNLLPEDRRLTLHDRKRNAMLFLVGLAVLIVATLVGS